jgi:hypothetical protein
MVDLLYDFPGISSLSGSSMRMLWNPSISMIWMRSRKSNSEVIFWNSWILNISYLAPSQCNSWSLISNSFQRLGSSIFWEVLSVPQVFIFLLSYVRKLLLYLNIFFLSFLRSREIHFFYLVSISWSSPKSISKYSNKNKFSSLRNQGNIFKFAQVASLFANKLFYQFH